MSQYTSVSFPLSRCHINCKSQIKRRTFCLKQNHPVWTHHLHTKRVHAHPMHTWELSSASACQDHVSLAKYDMQGTEAQSIYLSQQEYRECCKLGDRGQLHHTLLQVRALSTVLINTPCSFPTSPSFIHSTHSLRSSLYLGTSPSSFNHSSHSLRSSLHFGSNSNHGFLCISHEFALIPSRQ